MAANHQQRTIIAAIGAAIGLISGVFDAGSYLDPFDDQPFLQSTWATTNSETRASMARDAIKQLPIGMSAAQVRELLGETKPVSRFSGAVDAYGNRLLYPETWSYYLGSWSLYGFDDGFLYVHLDADSEVASVEITGG